MQIYLELSKSGIVTLVLISVLGGYFIGHPLDHPFQLKQLLFTLAGVLCLASGSSALNQYQEREIDALMPRTTGRPIPSGRISPTHALAFAGVLIVAGLVLLWIEDIQTFALGVLAVISYNILYTLWWKKRWAFAAVPGAIPGALPILMGYSTARQQVLTPGGVYLFILLFFWQMPHFWVLAMHYQADYARGGIPTLPVAKGESLTRLQITLWCLAYIALALMAPLFLRVRVIYLLAAVSVSLKLLWELRRFITGHSEHSGPPKNSSWLRFFLWVNFSLIILITAAGVDIWGVY